jgi:competence protein ComEC
MFFYLTPSALGWIAGTALQLQQAQLWSMGAYAACGGVAALGGGFGWRALAMARGYSQSVVTTGLCLAVAGVLAFALAGARASHYVTTTLNPDLEGRTLHVVGLVANLPQRMDDSARFWFRVESARDALGASVSLPPQLLLGWYGQRVQGNDDKLQPPPTDLRPGDRWQLTVRLKAPHGHINPHGFDYELWLWEQNLQATGYVRNGAKEAPPQWLGRTWTHPVELMRQRVRSAIDRQVADRAVAGIIAALLVGDQASIERADWDVFRATGVAHLMAISGLHITGLAWLAAWGIAGLWRRSDVWSPHSPWSLRVPAPLAASGCALAVAFAYALFTGWGVPAQRTVWMLGVVTLLRWQGLRWPWPQTWLTVCAVVLALDPWALMQAGFWLSFVAVGVLFASGSATPAVGLWAAAKRMGREQWLMGVCLAPLTLLLFQQVSVVGLFVNLWAVPWVTLVVTPLCLLGLVLPLSWGLAGEALQALVWVLKACAHVPWAQWSAPAAPLWAGAAALVGMGLLVLRLPGWMRCLGLALVLPVLSWQTPRPAQGSFDLLAADMGQGHAVLVRTAKHSLLYDTGPRYSAETDAGQRVLVPLLRALGERLDRIVISHQDSDHSGGAASVIAMQPQADVWSSMPEAHPLQRLHTMQPCERGQSWAWDGVLFEVLHPSGADFERKLKPNALSCVLRVSTPQTAALLAGDIEAAQEKSLLANTPSLRADWLLVPHHGSATSSTPAFLEAVQPSVAVVQAGYRNRFGHPRPDVLEHYHDLGVLVVQTPRCGASRWHSDRPKLVQCERNQRQRYWHHLR